MQSTWLHLFLFISVALCVSFVALCVTKKEELTQSYTEEALRTTEEEYYPYYNIISKYYQVPF